VPTNWLPDVESVNAVIDSKGPWPAPSPQSNGRFVALDVDRHGGLAVVVGFGPNLRGIDVLRTEEFKRTETGQWEWVSGGGGSHDLNERSRSLIERQTLHLRMSGKSGWTPLNPRTWIEHAVFLCGLDVASVEIRRRGGVRIADVRTGPGWLGVVWAEGDPPEVVAFAAQGSQTFSWTPPGNVA
jgi:hypothetical protein